MCGFSGGVIFSTDSFSCKRVNPLAIILFCSARLSSFLLNSSESFPLSVNFVSFLARDFAEISKRSNNFEI